MNLGADLINHIKEVDESTKDITSIKEMWDAHHKADEPFLLSGSPGKQVWKALDILDEINAGKKILNIGVGLGLCTKELCSIGSKVHVLDISTVALKRVENIVEGTWLPGQLPDLPKSYFDLAISHLVAQHMSDADLLDQIKFVLKSLKPDGFFAIQIAYSKRKDDEFSESFYTLKWGGALRSLSQINELVQKAGGQIVWADNILDYPDMEMGWYGVHIVKNNPDSINKYYIARLNKKISALIELQGDHFRHIGNIDRALCNYSDSLNFNNQNLNVLKKSSETYNQKDEKVKAIDLLIKALELDHSDLEAVLMLGQLYLELNEFIKAYNLFIEFKDSHRAFPETGNIKFMPETVEAVITLGDVFFYAGLYRQSEKIYQMASNIFPGDRDLLNKIAYSELHSEENTDKIDNQFLKLQIAELAIETSEFYKARLFLDDILSIDPEDVSALIDFGVLNILENNHRGATLCFNKVLEIDPGNIAAKENLEAIESIMNSN